MIIEMQCFMTSDGVIFGQEELFFHIMFYSSPRLGRVHGLYWDFIVQEIESISACDRVLYVFLCLRKVTDER